MADIPPMLILDIVIEIKIYLVYYHRKGHKKDTEVWQMLYFFQLLASNLVFIFVQS